MLSHHCTRLPIKIWPHFFTRTSTFSVTNSTTPHEQPSEPPRTRIIDFKMPLVDAKNPVPHYQRFYQNAYKNHTRLWKIGPRSRMLMTPYLILLWGSLGASFYGAGRKVLGYNSYFGN
ncbi:hypothetical protein NXS19_002346 [Fusarium pseudograminearum]|nr:hypothetical protein NXS19_002346 [Fusarium pseudograminearum]